MIYNLFWHLINFIWLEIIAHIDIAVNFSIEWKQNGEEKNKEFVIWHITSKDGIDKFLWNDQIN